MSDNTILEKMVLTSTEFYAAIGEMKKAADKASEQFLSDKTLVHCGECIYARESTEEFSLEGSPLYRCAYSKMLNAAREYCSWGVKKYEDNPK